MIELMTAAHEATPPYPPERAWRYVLWLLGRRAYSKAELRERLGRKGAEPHIIDELIAKLERLELIDDQAYAASYVASRKQRKGVLALRRELQQRGVGAAEIEHGLEPIDESEQKRTAAQLLDKHRWRFKGDLIKRKRKAYAFLARRGFPSDIVREVLEQHEHFREAES